MSLAETIEDAICWEVEARRIPSISYALVDRDRTLASGHVARPGLIPPTESSLFRIGSLTKMVTAVAAMQLAGTGQLGLDDDIGNHLQIAPGATLRQILSHTSGLTREARTGHYLDDSEPPLAETVRSLAAFPRKVAPGIYRYSNAGFALMGALVEARAGVPYADYLREHIFTPLGMNDTAVGFDATSKARIAPAQMWSFSGDTSAPLFNLGGPAAGNVVSTLGDMGRFARAMLRDGLLPRKAMEAPWSVPGGGERGYGLGFAIDRLDGRRTVGHGGVVYGYASLLTALPDDGLAIVLFGTMDMTNSVLSRIGTYALRLALAERGDGKLPRPLVRTTPVIGRELSGDYWRTDGSDRIELRERDDGLFLLESGVPLEIRANGKALVIDGRLQGQDGDDAFLPVEVVPEGIRWRGELWTAQPPPFVAPPSDLAPHLGIYGPRFLPLHLFFRDGKLRGSAEGLAAHTCDPIGDNRYVMRGWLLEDEVLEVGLVRNGRAALKVGEMLFERLD
jgi:CubicO group peptidase (beta-lactamase class C family)